MPAGASLQQDEYMKASYRIAVLGAIAAVANLSACHVHDDHGPYRYENGDRIDRDGRREVRWCENHHEDENCRR
jgi:hypothetical protein